MRLSDGVSEVLSEEDDAFGRRPLDYMAGKAPQLILELDDGRAGPALPADVFFAEHREWPAQEQWVFDFVHGTRSRHRPWGPEGIASRRSGAGSASWPSTSLPGRSRHAGGEECGMLASFLLPPSMRPSVSSTRL
jgi:hypothetical protein